MPATPHSGRVVLHVVMASVAMFVGVLAALLVDSTPARADDSVTAFPGLVAVGADHTCGILTPGQVSCWGRGADGRLGYGSTRGVADGVGPSIAEAGPVPVGGDVTQVVVGDEHSCALLGSGAVRCWGRGDDGRLGYVTRTDVGDGKGPSIQDAGDVPLSGPATAVAASGSTTCALLSDGSVSCWGRLAAPHTISLPEGAVAIGAGDNQSCAVLSGGAVDCWAPGGAVTALSLDGTAQDVAVGPQQSCALLDTGEVECWQGVGAPAPVQLDPAAVAVAVGGDQACAIAEDAAVWCWTGDAAPAAVGVTAHALSVGANDVCTIDTSSKLACWGAGAYGVLGTGDVQSRHPDGSPVVAADGSNVGVKTVTFGGTTQADAKAAAEGRVLHHGPSLWWLLGLVPIAAAVAAVGVLLRHRATGSPA